jgi:hypothetical protein
MKFTTALRHLLPLLAVIGLLLTPMTRSVSAMSAMHSEAAGAAEDAVASMPADMPCCPDKAPASGCAKDCPLLAICMSSCMQNLSGTGLLIPHRLAGLVVPGNDASPEHLGQAPPGRPPKA